MPRRREPNRTAASKSHSAELYAKHWQGNRRWTFCKLCCEVESHGNHSMVRDTSLRAGECDVVDGNHRPSFRWAARQQAGQLDHGVPLGRNYYYVNGREAADGQTRGVVVTVTSSDCRRGFPGHRFHCESGQVCAQQVGGLGGVVRKTLRLKELDC